MSNPGPADLFEVNLRQLSADLKKAAYAYPDVPLGNMPASKVLKLLKSAEALAPQVAYPAAPEIRIVAPTGQFVVQFKEGRLKLVSWAKAAAGGVLSAQQIGAIIVGEAAATTASSSRAERAVGGTRSRIQHYITMTLLGAAIIGTNVFTVWFLTRPPKSLLPKYRLLEREPAERLLASAAGEYATGEKPGDRRLHIRRDGVAVWGKFGADRAVTKETNFTLKGAETGGQPALLTSKRALITIKDPMTVVLHGDTYQRKPQ